MDAELHELPQVASAQGRIPLVTRQVSVGEHSFELLYPRSVDELIDERDFDVDGRLPYWAELWPSGRALAERVSREPGQGRRLLELGAGIGLVSLVAARVGFAVVTTDYYEAAVELLRANAERNAVGALSARTLDWRAFPTDLGRFDVVAASDVLYERPNAALVAEAFQRTLTPDGLGLVSDPGRRTAESFAEVCQRHGLSCIRTARIPMVDGTSHPTVDLYELRHLAKAQPNMTGTIQVMTTVGARAEADKIARLLVERRLAACVQVLGPIESVYRWQEKIETSQEWLCLIKSKQTQFAAIEQAIREVHSYEVPEIVALPITAGSAAYLKWLHDEVRDD